jgi:uncharacterized protein (TIGR02246 family)
MRKFMFLAAASVFSVVAAVVWAQQKPSGPAQPVKGAPAAKGTMNPAKSSAAPAKATLSRADDEQAIRQAVDAMLNAYNTGDSQAVAAMFTPDALIVDAQGHSTQGRDGIQQAFANVFKQHPQARQEVSISLIRFVAPAVAIEEGTSTTINAPDETPQRMNYSVVHVKQEGKWLMASARDLENEEATAQSELDQLGWLVGEWVDESPDGLVKTRYSWTDNHVYLVSEFKMQIGGQTALSGTQRMCWDPLINKIRSWVFDSEGGFSQGTWTRNGNQWIVKLSGVTRAGLAGSATHVIKRISADKYSWQAHDRIVGDDVTPDTQEIVVVRRPPGPEISTLPNK